MLRHATVRSSFRDFEPSDYERLVEIYNANFPDSPTSVKEAQYWDGMYDTSKFLYKRYSFVDTDSKKVVGFGKINHAMWMFHLQKFMVDVLVDPTYQRKGLGSEIYARLARELEERHAVTAWASVKEDMPGAMSFAKKNGYFEKRRAWVSRLTPSEVDMKLFEKYTEKTGMEGIRISTLAEEEKSDSQAVRKLYELVQQVTADVPMAEPYTRVSFEQWQTLEMKNPNMIPEGYFIAKDGSDQVGLSCVWRIDKEPRSLNQAMTGVLRRYRGRGIAVALKLRVVRYALENGYDRIKTWNDSDNAPMLAVNNMLGFKREVGWITLEKNLANAS